MCRRTWRGFSCNKFAAVGAVAAAAAAAVSRSQATGPTGKHVITTRAIYMKI